MIFLQKPWEQTVGDLQRYAEHYRRYRQVRPGAAEHIEFAELRRWREEYLTVGCYRDLGRFRQLCEKDRRVQLAGDFQSFQNLESATISGLRAAERLLDGPALH
jgi:oxygen-dependent protoporphyrinogen oxidase